MQPIIEKQRELGNEEVALEVQKAQNADLSQFDLDQSMNSQVNNEFKDGLDESNALGQDLPDDIEVGNVHFTTSLLQPQSIDMIGAKGTGSPDVRSFIQIEKQRSRSNTGSSFYSNVRNNIEANIQDYDDQHQGAGSFLESAVPVDVVNVDMINNDVLNHNLNTSQMSQPQKFDDSTSAIGNGSGGNSGNSGHGQREFFDETNIHASSIDHYGSLLNDSNNHLAESS